MENKKMVAYAEGIEKLEGDARVQQIKEWRKKYEEENKWILDLEEPDYDDEDEEEDSDDEKLNLDNASDNYFEQSYGLVSQIAEGIRKGLKLYKQNTTEEEREEFIDESCARIEVNEYWCSITIDFGEFYYEFYCDEKMMDCLVMLEYLEEKDRLVVSQETDHWLDDSMPGSETLKKMGLEGLSLEYPC